MSIHAVPCEHVTSICRPSQRLWLTLERTIKMRGFERSTDVSSGRLRAVVVDDVALAVRPAGLARDDGLTAVRTGEIVLADLRRAGVGGRVAAGLRARLRVGRLVELDADLFALVGGVDVERVVDAAVAGGGVESKH